MATEKVSIVFESTNSGASALYGKAMMHMMWRLSIIIERCYDD